LKAFLRELITTILMAGVIFLIMQSAISFPPSEVISSSMEPTLQIGQRLIISKVTYLLHKPERGDIITFRQPNHPKQVLIKRLIGLPGESVEIKEGKVYIHKEDGSVLPLDETYYVKSPSRSNYQGEKIPENEYFVMGDNRNNSSDSRTGWTVPRKNIIGKAWITWISVFPPKGWGLAPNYSFPKELNSTELLPQSLLAQL
jgi:signal peptidase I